MTKPTALRVQRTFNAPARDVFEALVNPEVMRRWWHAGEDWETPHAEQVDITLTERDRVTEAVLTHEGLADAESAEGHAEGWEVNLAHTALGAGA